MNRIIYGYFINGLLIPVILPNSFILTALIDLYVESEVSITALLHFMVINFSLTALVIYNYKLGINYIKSKTDIKIYTSVAVKYYWLILIFFIINLIINIINVYMDSDVSRIAYQNERWYSFFRVISLLISPFAGLAIFIYFRARKIRLALSILIVYIAGNILSGSKSGFVFGLFGAALIYRDLFGIYKYEIKKIINVFALIICFASINFYYMGIDTLKIFNRLIYFAEDSIMVYPLVAPTEACSENSTLSNIHRGIARLIGDEGALRFDTLYGISLSNIFYGSGSTTGPGASMAAYARCAYPGWLLLLFFAIVFLYLGVLWFVFKSLLKEGSFIKAFGAALFLYFIVNPATDYNNMMSAFSTLIIIVFFILFKKLI